jgi:hypothetical protein
MLRFLASVKYKIQTDSIKENLIPKLEISKRKEFLIYASELHKIYMTKKQKN